uniref:Uncharacterized protein n=1 Tax=Ovis aries TaxID=9940 RepID=A0AC11DQB3_SHEEP
MGSAESREGRRASFGMDEEERVRVLQGIRLSENVVNRMKEPGQPSRVGPLAPPAAALGSSGGREKDSKPPRPDCSSGRGPPRVPVDPLERCDWEQAVLQDELVRVATADRQAAEKPRSVTLRRGEGGVDQEQQRLAQRARELESQEAELRRRDAFYKEQLGRLERTSRRTGCRLSSSMRQPRRLRAPSSKGPSSSSQRAQPQLNTAPRGNPPLCLFSGCWRDTDSVPSCSQAPTSVSCQGSGQSHSRPTSCVSCRLRPPGSQEGVLPASRSWGFRGGLALSHIPLQDAGWGSLCRTGLSYSV